MQGQTLESAGHRLRGFTTQDMIADHLVTMKTDWHANSIRIMMRPDYICRTKGYETDALGWQEVMDQLPGYLDCAAELGIAVILDLHGVPNDNRRRYHRERKKALSDFWNDDSNLEAMIACWRQIAEMCVTRDQIVWYDILNEPLDWQDFPKVARKWPDWAQQTIHAIREIDPHSPAVVEVGPGGLCWGFDEFPVLEGEQIIYSTHQYQPHEYTHQGISNLNNTDLAKAYANAKLGWPGEFADTGGGWWDKTRMEEEMAAMIRFQERHEARIYISEFGVARWCPNGADYLRDNLEIFEAYGWDWSMHSYKENPIWCLEHEDPFEEVIPATSLTERGKVMKMYFEKNRFYESAGVGGTV